MRGALRAGLLAGAVLAALGGLFAAGSGARAVTTAAALVGSYTWVIDDPAFGGFSGLDLGPDGLTFLALSDKSATVAGKLIRDAAGAVTGVSARPITPLQGRIGKALQGYTSDSEGLALAPGGGFYVSFEGHHRIEYFADAGAGPVQVPPPRDFRGFANNTGLEALAVEPDGTLWTMPEDNRGRARGIPVFRNRAGTWDRPFLLSADGDWKPVGADVGPDGRLYVLERALRLPFGFAARVRQIDLGTAPPGDVTVLETAAGTHDNLEGIAVWADDTGAIRLTMISDDNFRLLQRTEFVDYRLPPG